MFEEFEHYLRRSVPELTDEQISQIRSVSVLRKVRKRHRFLQVGEICRYKLFVISGLVRIYSVADDGSEYVMRFITELGWSTDPESFLNQTPSKYTIEAMEAAEVVLWSRDDFERLRTDIPALGAFSESLMLKTISESQKRVLMDISFTTEEKYQHFVTSFPDVSRRVPLHMIASYLGVSRETLTRIRQGMAVAEKG